jgi:alkylation response protein AidB-like acyl-CoA dehydrogenase
VSTHITAAARLAPLIAEAAAEVEANGCLPQFIVDRLTEAELFSLYLPAAVGGPEVDPVTAFLVIEQLAQADGSVGWCAHVSSGISWFMNWLTTATVREMTDGGRRAMRFSGSARPLGKARPVEGGFRVTGRWDFASNCLHAEWYSGACVVEEPGRKRVRAMMIPVNEGKVIETWQVTGLRGTGSHDFAVDDLFVPAAHVQSLRHAIANGGRLFDQRLTLVAGWAPTAAVAIGIAGGALRAFITLAEQATANQVTVPLRDRREIQGTVGRVAAMLGAARSSCLAAIAEASQAVASGREDVDREILAARLAIPYAMQTSVEAVTLLFHAGGTRSIFASGGLDRRFRDIHVAVQHFAGSPDHFQAGGRILLGLPAGAPFW